MLDSLSSELARSAGKPDPPIINHIPCAVLRCGTSRAVIVDGASLPAGNNIENHLISLLAGENTADGLGGDHYQFNKIAVIYPGGDTADFLFRFYQLELPQRRLIGSLECANVAAGAGLVAHISGLANVSLRGSLRAMNLGTGQLVELGPLDGLEDPVSEWTVRFLSGPDGAFRLYTPEAQNLVHADGRNLEFWVVERGNLFVLANASPEAAEPELIEALAEQGRGIGSAMGCEASKAAAPKVVLYSVQAQDAVEAWIRAACYFEGQMHHSLPGSAAMCLSSFLTTSYLSALWQPAAEGWMRFRLENPGAELCTRVYWNASPQGIDIVSTEFDTSVRLLFWGIAPMRRAAWGA